MQMIGNPYIPASDGVSSGVGGTLKFSVVSGGGSGTDLTVSGIKPEDTITHVHDFAGVDRTGDLLKIKSGAIQLGGVTTAGHKLQVGWLDRLP